MRRLKTRAKHRRKVADARAKVDLLQVYDVDPAANDAALRRLALWATRYTPAVSLWGEKNGADGFFLDVTGAAHLFGGEEKLLTDLSQRLSHFGLPARLAIADTPGAAWALSRFHAVRACLLPSGRAIKVLESLPVEGACGSRPIHGRRFTDWVSSVSAISPKATRTICFAL